MRSAHQPIRHIYTVGTSGSGKSTVIRRLADRVRKHGRPVIVFDPEVRHAGKGRNGWTGCYVTGDFDHFDRLFWANQGCLTVIDEAADVCEHNPHRKLLRRMLRFGRHVVDGVGGHTVAMIAQRHVMMDKSARTQCLILYAFAVDPDDADDLARTWLCPQLATLLPTLRVGQYVYLEKFGTPKLGQLTF